MTNYVVCKLSAHPYANAHVELYQNGTIALYSYNTCVAEIDVNGWLTVNGLFSNTTRRHLGSFAKEYIKFPNGQSGDYYLMKWCVTNNLRFNVNTGEIEEI